MRALIRTATYFGVLWQIPESEAASDTTARFWSSASCGPSSHVVPPHSVSPSLLPLSSAVPSVLFHTVLLGEVPAPHCAAPFLPPPPVSVAAIFPLSLPRMSPIMGVPLHPSSPSPPSLPLRARMCGLPSDCRVCGTTLVSSPHLARSYHHLFPVPPFKEVPLPPSSAPSHSLPSQQPLQHSQQKPRSGSAEPLPATCFSCLSSLPLTGESGLSEGSSL